MKVIGRVSMFVEVDGKVCAVALPQDRMRLLVDLAASLSDTGVLPVREMDGSFHFEEIT